MIYEENGQYRDEIYDMWQRNFHDPAPYADFYFQEVYGKNEILLNAGSAPEMTPGEWEETPALKMMGESEEIIRGMLHLNPYELLVRGREQQAHYIVGVATDKAFRRQGVMRELLLETFSRLRKRGEPFTYLMPADENYYLPFDFRFGMKELEREIECFGKAPAAQNPRFTFEAGLPEDLSEICEAENASRGREFAICTRITPAYLTRMKKKSAVISDDWCGYTGMAFTPDGLSWERKMTIWYSPRSSAWRKNLCADSSCMRRCVSVNRNTITESISLCLRRPGNRRCILREMCRGPSAPGAKEKADHVPDP